MHLFFTGGVGCGKSTLVDKILAGYRGNIGGFRTGFGPDRESPDRLLYLWCAGGPPRFDNHHGVVRWTGGSPSPLPGQFDALGAASLEGTFDLLVMDECGRLERDALRFQAAALTRLDGDVPVLGVVRQGFPGWTAQIAAHPKVKLVEVTTENRDRLAAKYSGWPEQ